ncbi:MAG: acetyl-CoA carboxylase biotin carboxyl carrier protein [Chloroflexia bacterium]|nr:acetyl-CoA carboxylase biotin carboxyl carrier protein [Chloroflexia bacterium]
MRQAAITELDLDLGSLSVRLRRPDRRTDDISNAASQADEGEILGSPVSDNVITAPMIGTFYSAAAPGILPFVTEGDEVLVGQTIGIIEAMKIMNEITADKSGVVESILVGNGQPVEYGSPLLRLGQTRAERA